MFKSKMSIGFFLLFIIGCIETNAQKMPLEYSYNAQNCLLSRGGNNFKGLYDIESVDTIFLEFNQANYWSLLSNNYDSKTDIPATLKYNGKTYENVGVRFKGMTSYQMNNTEKKSFNISLDYLSDQDIDGYTTLNLNNSYEDPSRIREFLYLYYNRKHIPAAKANFIILVINNSSWGIYTNVQQLNKQHVKEWFGNADATRWRAEGDSTNIQIGGPGLGPGDGFDPGGGFGPGDSLNPGGGFIPDDSMNFSGGLNPGGVGGFGSGFGAGFSTLNYLGNDTASYQGYYTLKSAYKDNSWDDLVNACKILNTVDLSSLVDSLSTCMDIDGALWFLAQEILFTDDDSYVNKGGMDYCVYFDVGTNRLIPIEYDGNSSFVVADATQWSPFYKEENKDFPLMNVLFKVPELRQRYLAHVRTILNESLNPNSANTLIDHYVELIDNHINNDPKKIYSYNEFKNETVRIKSFISNRYNYLKNHVEINVSTPVISSVEFKVDDEKFLVPDETDSVIVTASVTSEKGISKVYLYVGTEIEGRFNRIEMFDNGENGDNSLNDNIYGATIPAFEKSTFVRFYIEAVDASTNKTRSYSPEGAEHNVFAYRVKAAQRVSSEVVINEVMPSHSIHSDQVGETGDWIELYNNSNNAIDLSGYYLSDNSNKLKKWKFPNGTAIGSQEYLIVWADEDTLQTGLHANFKLSSDGEEVLLITPDIYIADQVIYNEQNGEMAFARFENGTGSFTWLKPTFNSENLLITTSIALLNLSEETELMLYPNPAHSSVQIEVKNYSGKSNLKIMDLYGRNVYEAEIDRLSQIDVTNFSNGVYIVSLNNNIYKRLVIRN